MAAMPRSPLAPAVIPDPPALPGVRFAAAAAGIRYRDRLDLALAAFAPGTAVAGLFTRSMLPGHPIPWCRACVARGRARALLVNAGNANVFRGREGDEAVRREALAVAQALGVAPEEVLIASTGVIGERLPVERIEAAVPTLAQALAPEGGAAFARAILTTDTFPKIAFRRIDGAGGSEAEGPLLVGIAKGSGMIAPNMATMLAFLFTDLELSPQTLQMLLREAAEDSFHAITVDGDTSTSDMVLLFATGRRRAERRLRDAFARALAEVSQELARLVVRDGEGAEKLVEIRVRGAASDAAARRIAMAVANSPLVKTAIAAGDANWGRVVAAVGKAGEPLEPERVRIAFGGHEVARGGAAVPDLDEAPVAAHLAGREILLEIDVGLGPGRARVWTCDLTHRYIDINAGYRS